MLHRALIYTTKIWAGPATPHKGEPKHYSLKEYSLYNY